MLLIITKGPNFHYHEADPFVLKVFFFYVSEKLVIQDCFEIYVSLTLLFELKVKNKICTNLQETKTNSRAVEMPPQERSRNVK